MKNNSHVQLSFSQKLNVQFYNNNEKYDTIMNLYDNESLYIINFKAKN